MLSWWVLSEGLTMSKDHLIFQCAFSLPQSSSEKTGTTYGLSSIM